MSERSDLNAEESFRLWKSAKAGDQASLETILRRHQDLIFRFCRSQLMNESLAIEATQETAVRMISKLASFHNRGKLSTWILGIANNVCREMRRQNEKWQQPSEDWLDHLSRVEPSSCNRPTDELVEKEAVTHLQVAVARLPDRQREAIVLRYFESLPLAQVAEVMQVSTGTVKATINQALNKLKITFNKDIE